jgi:hypothetical protein
MFKDPFYIPLPEDGKQINLLLLTKKEQKIILNQLALI